jgi:sugar-phosphatase
MITLPCKAILFDMDGTLLDSNEASEMIWQRWAKNHQVPIEKIREVHHGRRPEETVALVAPHLNPIQASKIVYDEQEHLREGINPIAGATDFYRSLKPGMFAIVTAATQPILNLRLSLVGLTPPEVCVTATSVQKGKPDPEGYLLAAKRLGVDPKDCIVFEDAPAGLIAAHRAGMRSIAVTTNYTEAALRKELGNGITPDAFIADYTKIKFTAGSLQVSK